MATSRTSIAPGLAKVWSFIASTAPEAVVHVGHRVLRACSSGLLMRGDLRVEPGRNAVAVGCGVVQLPLGVGEKVRRRSRFGPVPGTPVMWVCGAGRRGLYSQRATTSASSPLAAGPDRRRCRVRRVLTRAVELGRSLPTAGVAVGAACGALVGRRRSSRKTERRRRVHRRSHQRRQRRPARPTTPDQPRGRAAGGRAAVQRRRTSRRGASVDDEPIGACVASVMARVETSQASAPPSHVRH